jgi:hypothetical protein
MYVEGGLLESPRGAILGQARPAQRRDARSLSLSLLCWLARRTPSRTGEAVPTIVLELTLRLIGRGISRDGGRGTAGAPGRRIQE